MQLPKQVTLVAVTKNRTLDEILKVISEGVIHIGENRLQEAEQKLTQFPDRITKHFIGRLQKNKVARVVRLFDVIQSVNSLKLAQKIETECAKLFKTMPILIQVNTSREPQKSGCSFEETVELVKAIAKLPHLRIQGLMTIAVQSEDPEKVRACFRLLKNLFDEIVQQKIPGVEMKWLSMGMSDDYEIAIEEGANMVRLGRILFTDWVDALGPHLQ